MPKYIYIIHQTLPDTPECDGEGKKEEKDLMGEHGTMMNDLFNSLKDFLCMLDLLGVTFDVVILQRNWILGTPNRCTCITNTNSYKIPRKQGARRDRLTP